MAGSTDRAAFVKQEYRRTTATDQAVKDRNPKARTITLDSNLDEASAVTLAAKVLAANKAPRIFDFEIEGVMPLDSFIGGCPSFIPDFPEFSTDGRTMKVVSASTDYEAGTTLLRVRG